MPTLLDYLTQPNPVLDRSNLQQGPNTSIGGSYEIEGVRPWTDFTIQNILECFGDVLTVNIPSDQLHQPPPIMEHHRRLTDEACVSAVLTKHNHVRVDCALQVASRRLRDRGLRLPISWSWGSLSDVQEDPRLRPDWAGTVHSGNVPYPNLVPGDTKQSAKWKSNMNTPRQQEEFRKPFRQGLTYCVKLNTRYGYIVTDAEATYFRRTKSAEPASPLSTNRPQRQNIQPSQPIHSRVLSINSATSGVTAMSLDSSGSGYTDAGNPDINETPLEVCTVDWGSSGGHQLTVNLGLWFIHMLATSDNSVKEGYPELGSWQAFTDSKGQSGYRQVGSNKFVKTLPKGAPMAKISAPVSSGGPGPSSASASTVPSSSSSAATSIAPNVDDNSPWRNAVDDKGQNYHYNRKTRQSTFDREFKDEHGLWYYNAVTKKSTRNKPTGRSSLIRIHHSN